MPRILQVGRPVQPHVVAASLADIDTDVQQIASRLIAARFGLAPHVAHLICRLADIGQREAA